MTLYSKAFKVNIKKDNAYRIGSSNNEPYELVLNTYCYEHSNYYETLSIAIDNYASERRIAILGTMFTEDQESAILTDNDLIVLVDSALIVIDCHTLGLKANKELPEGVYFSIHDFDDGYIVYGELEIVKVSAAPEYNVEWAFSGADIFVTQDKSRPFEIKGDVVYLRDWNGQEYAVSRNGKEL